MASSLCVLSVGSSAAAEAGVITQQDIKGQGLLSRTLEDLKGLMLCVSIESVCCRGRSRENVWELRV